jgi:hypothetical protein
VTTVNIITINLYIWSLLGISCVNSGIIWLTSLNSLWWVGEHPGVHPTTTWHPSIQCVYQWTVVKLSTWDIPADQSVLDTWIITIDY